MPPVDFCWVPVELVVAKALMKLGISHGLENVFFNVFYMVLSMVL